MNITKKRIIIASAMLLLFVTIILIAVKKISPISLMIWGDINNTQGVAVKGYDVVNYYQHNTAKLGKKHYQVNWHGVSWQFINKENKILFIQNPEKYAPQYGGYCSFAVSQGFTANSDPSVWYIANQKLYLFMDQEVKLKWITNNGVKASDKSWLIKR